MSETNTATETRRRGRPSSFPADVETVPFLAKIPKDARDMVREIAAKREIPINAALDLLIRRGYKAVTK